MPDDKMTFPVISGKAWWAIRERFQTTLRGKVTDTFLAGLLQVDARSARNFLGPLKRMGIIDADGSPTELAAKWRDDEQYPDACRIIKEQCYPHEVLDLFHDPEVDVNAVERWFRNYSGVGDSAARQQAALYILLTKADPTRANEIAKSSTTSSSVKPQSTKSHRAATTRREAELPSVADAMNSPSITRSPQTPTIKNIPSLHIDIQIHIAPDTPADQIDKIFASMAKHLHGIKDSAAE